MLTWSSLLMANDAAFGPATMVTAAAVPLSIGAVVLSCVSTVKVPVVTTNSGFLMPESTRLPVAAAARVVPLVRVKVTT